MVALPPRPEAHPLSGDGLPDTETTRTVIAGSDINMILSYNHTLRIAKGHVEG
jgi:hypothetical protein